MQLLQLLFTSDSGNISSTLVGEETLYWLNVNYISPSAEEGPALDAFEKPWLQDEFWELVFK
jgi:nuclear pore complex protein Nup85